VPKEIANHADIAAAKAAVDLADQAANAGPTGPLKDAVARDPADHRARIDLATALYAGGQTRRRSTICWRASSATAPGTKKRRASSW